MAARFRADAALASRIAAACQPHVQRIAEDVGTAVRRTAPDGKTWVTSHDEKVRPSHVHTDGQEIPGNLRYQLPRYTYIRGSHGQGYADTGQVDLAREPRDEALPADQRINCRCVSVPVPGAIARATRVDDVHAEGPRVVGAVTVHYNRVAESEYPDGEDHGGGWAAQAVREAAARLRTR
jgi:hypothetical protein